MDQTFGLLNFVRAESYARGVVYASQRRASVSEFDRDEGLLRGVTAGSNQRTYEETIRLDFDDDTQEFTRFEASCTCPQRGQCKHCVALALTAFELLPKALRPDSAATAPGRVLAQPDAASSSPRYGNRGQAPVPWQRDIVDVFSQRPADDVDLALELDFVGPSDSELTGATGRVYPTRGHLYARPLRRGKQKARKRWVKSGITIANLRSGVVENARPDHVAAISGLSQLSDTFTYYSPGPKDAFRLDTVRSPLLGPLLQRALEVGVTLVDGTHQADVVVESEPARAEIGVTETAEGILVEAIISHPALDEGAALELGQPVQAIAWKDDELHIAFLDEAPTREWQALKSRKDGIAIPAAGKESFEAQVFPRIARIPWSSPDSSFEPPEQPEPTLHVTFTLEDAQAHHPRVDVRWAWMYGDGENALGPFELEIPRSGSVGIRDRDAEGRLLARVAPIVAEAVPDLVDDAGELAEPRLRPHTVLEGGGVLGVAELIDALRAEGVAVNENLPEYHKVELPKVQVDVEDSSRDWLDLKVQVSVGDQVVPTGDLVKALTLEHEYLFLEDGSYLDLARPELDSLRELVLEARSLSDRRTGGLRVPKVRQTWWEELLSLGIVDAAHNSWFESIRLAATKPVEPAAVPAELNAELRPYQVAGYQWLASLRDAGLGGVLADDMGLGKTLQILAMILHDRDRRPGAGPWLVVAPTSVVGNWVSEAQKFTPSLNVVGVESTSRRASAELHRDVAGADIVVTSYTLLRLDTDAYRDLGVTGMVLDEAQNVKNHTSKGFAAVASIGAPSTFAVTGTPIENNLGELWAMFALAAPGLLGTHKQFRDAFRKPIEDNVGDGGDPEVASEHMDRLRRRIAPFLLRRTKKSVALDLPDKQEQIIRVELEPEHRRLYDRQLQRERQNVLQLTTDIDHNRVEVLSALNRLRQLAIDPRLVDENSHAPASKMHVLLPLLEEATDEGHRVLVFSQFTRFLRHIGSELEERGIEYAYLDGATRNRAKVISDFSTGDAPIFLISLKAGGTGLNLTMADYAILTDPWWNPAAEEQAVDRTHRIGQTKPVHVYRMVSTDTVEEKVVALQDSKRKLLAVLSDDPTASMGTGGKALTGEELRALLT